MNEETAVTGNTKLNTSKLTLTRRMFLRAAGSVGAWGSLRPLALFCSPIRVQAPGAAAGLPPCFAGARTFYPPLLERFIQKLDPAADVFPTEVYAAELGKTLATWSAALCQSPADAQTVMSFLAPDASGASLQPASVVPVGTKPPLRVERRSFGDPSLDRAGLLRSWVEYASSFERMDVAEFEIYGVRVLGEQPLRIESEIQYDLVGLSSNGTREQRTGSWRIIWRRGEDAGWMAERWSVGAETRAELTGPGFTEITADVLDVKGPAARQLSAGIDDWRSALDSAIGLDVYGNHGVAVGDVDGSGRDSIYVCQPSGLPNRLFRNRGDGTFEDITDSSGTGVLDGTASALFADFLNRGHQDLLVVRSGGPLLFQNLGDGRFEARPDAFRFQRAPQGTFTSVAAADYDRDGLLDVYLCVYSYYQGLSQYQFPSPYYDAQNGPPNFLFRNRGDGTFEDVSVSSGMDVNNNRFSFAAEWCDYDGDGWPDVYVANDFGRKNLYHNNRNGTFEDVAAKAGVEDYGPGMSTCWLDYDGDGRLDLYVANMWLREGKRITAAPQFLPGVPEETRALYRKHNAGNSMYRNRGDGSFADETDRAGTARGGWSWSCGAWDFDHGGAPGVYVANGFVSGPLAGNGGQDLQSFFWRQVAQRSAEPPGSGNDYELAWNAVNELVRSDYSWSGYERNVFYSNNGDGTFTDVSGVLGLDLRDDSRAFGLADFDGDGRLEFVLKNRTAPQLRVMRNSMEGLGNVVVLRLVGHTSNRDAIGSLVTVEHTGRRQVKQLSAGSGFASQHTKEMFFGVGDAEGEIAVTVRWPDGRSSHFEHLPANQRITLEEGKGDFKAAPFRPARVTSGESARLPKFVADATVSTWLAAPLFGPELMLSDDHGEARTLSSLRGQALVLTFLDFQCGASAHQMELFEHGHAAFEAAGIAVYAVRVESETGGAAAAAQGAIPLLRATAQQIAGWNIQYRYLFDRRRTLSFPTSFLLNESGGAIRIYQGAVRPADVIADWKSAPSTAEARLSRAVPFKGRYFGNPVTRDDFTSAIAFVEYGLLDDAQAALERLLKANPGYAAAWFNLGTIFLNKKQYPEAERALREAVRLNPLDPDAWNNLGMIAGEQGRYDDALVSFRNSAKANPNHLAAVTNMMQIYQFQSRPAEAQAALEELISKSPENADLRLGMAMALQAQNDIGGAIVQLQTAIRIRPNFPDAINNLGTMLMQKDDRAGALEAFERCRRMAPDFDRPVLNESVLYKRTGQPQKAIDLLRDFLSAHPDNADVRTMLGER